MFIQSIDGTKFYNLDKQAFVKLNTVRSDVGGVQKTVFAIDFYPNAEAEDTPTHVAFYDNQETAYSLLVGMFNAYAKGTKLYSFVNTTANMNKEDREL